MTTAAIIKQTANDHIGIRKHSAGHKKIIDGYNAVSPRPMGYKVTYDDDWCDTFVSYIADLAKAAHLIGRECGVQRHIVIFKQLKIWIGRARPQVGDIICFDWQANGWADHIGYVTEVKSDTITTTEGNTNGGVYQNKFRWDDWRITGYARPNYGATASQPKKPIAEIAAEVLIGLWDNGQTRTDKLKAAGYDASQIQAEVNKLITVATPPVKVDANAFLSYNGDSLSVATVNDILEVARKYNINAEFLAVMLNFETLWGRAASAVANNNWGGMTWTGEPVRPSGVVVSQGTDRPVKEGGHYMKYANLADFFKDWGYLLRPGGIYKVSGDKSFNESVKGLFTAGGATYNYAASGYDHYLAGMTARRNQIEKFNPGKLAKIAEAFKAGKTIDGKDVVTELPNTGAGKALDVIAKEVVAGKWGNGENRVTALAKAGYDYLQVQAKVNALSKPQLKSVDAIAKEVLAGKWGNGKDRTEKLSQAGYAAQKVQAAVNVLLKPDLAAVARDVMLGKYGNGAARIRNLRAVGYNPDDVQALVNRM